jgi:hypothetical protein
VVDQARVSDKVDAKKCETVFHIQVELADNSLH